MNYIKCPKCGEEDPAFDYAHVCGPVEVKRKVMNERLKELMLEAGYAAPEIAGRANKLAELIVRECIQAVDNVGGYNEEFHMNAIKEHFGVEE
jgi:hypothetical protein